MNLKGILKSVTAAILVVPTAIMPNILTDGEKQQWVVAHYGMGTWIALWCAFIVSAILFLFITTDIAKSLMRGSGASRPELFNIPPGPASRRILSRAKGHISQGEPEDAFLTLLELKLPALSTEIDLLSSRLAAYQRAKRHGVEAPDAESRTFNQITRDARDLVSVLEKEVTKSAINYDDIRDFLKKRYINRLSKKLANRQPINLRRIPSSEGTSEEMASTFVAYQSAEIAQTIHQIFDDARGRLLVIGAPGAGKTTLMLQLVIELTKSDLDRLPVVLNLATWNQTFPNLEAWLKEILPIEMGISNHYAIELLEQNLLILILDGLDEVRKEDGIRCLEAIGRYGKDGQRKYAISSRKEAYSQIIKDAPVESQIEVGPLTIEQVEQELKRLWSDAEHPERGALLFWHAIRDNALVREVVQTPFYFNALQVLFSGSNTWADLDLKSDNLVRLQKEITARLVDYQLEETLKHYSKEQSVYWLSFIASRMKQRNLIALELRDFQYDWWRWNEIQLKLGRFTSGASEGFTFGILVGLAGSLLGVLFAESVSEWNQNKEFYMYLFGYESKVEFSLKAFVEMSEYWLKAQHETRKFLLLALGIAFVFSIFSACIRGIWIILSKGPISINTTGNIFFIRNRWSQIKGKVVWIFLSALFFSVLSGFLLGWAVGISLGIGLLIITMTLEIINAKSTQIIRITEPLQRFIISAHNFHFSILQYWVLQSQFYKAGLLPKKLVSFLNDMENIYFLESDGGTWRFRHRILQDYFAEKWNSSEADPLKE